MSLLWSWCSSCWRWIVAKRRFRPRLLGDVAAACKVMRTDPAMEILHELTTNPEKYDDKFRLDMYAELLQYVAPKKRSQDTTVNVGNSLAEVLSNLGK